jgi:hypothetical protein
MSRTTTGAVNFPQIQPAESTFCACAGVALAYEMTYNVGLNHDPV